MPTTIDLAETAVRKLAPALWEQYQHLEYLKGCEPKKSSTDPKVAEAVRNLEVNGIHTIEAYMPADWCDDVLAQTKPHLDALVAGRPPEQCRYMLIEDEPHKRIMDVHKLVPKAWEFFGDQFMLEVFQCYAAQNISTHQYMVDWRSGVGLTTQNDGWHFDDPYPSYKLKAFLYLNDVTVENGPFCYIPGTQINAPWRKKKNRDAWVNQKSGDWGFFTDNHLLAIKKKYGFKEKICTGKKGHLVLFDAGGLHKSSILRSGERFVLAPYYEIAEARTTFAHALKRRFSPTGR